MSIIDFAKTRYATKAFDNTKDISPETVQALKDLLRLSPSSVNAQPWHFIMAETQQGKERITKATQGPFAYNETKVQKASRVIVFCARTDLNENFLEKLTNQEATDGRFRSPDGQKEQHAKRAMYVKMHKDALHDLPAWTTRQTYLNIGFFLLGAASLGLDTVAMEGFDAATLDQEFDLTSKGLTSVALVAVGYHAADDFNANLPKSRLAFDEILTVV